MQVNTVLAVDHFAMITINNDVRIETIHYERNSILKEYFVSEKNGFQFQKGRYIRFWYIKKVSPSPSQLTKTT